jgi:broad specificity phosphatase PhoE
MDGIKALRGGGHVIVFRHGATHADQADTDPLNLANVAKQRQLNDQGRALAREIGEAMRKLQIRSGRSTPACSIARSRPARCSASAR